jgi:hypothetical protein
VDEKSEALWKPVTDALLQGPTAWQSPTELARALNHNLDDMIEILVAMCAAGWLEIFGDESQALVTLTPWSAERLGVQLVEVGDGEEDLRWSRKSAPAPRKPRRAGRSRARTLPLETLGLIDPRPGPEIQAIRAEYAEWRERVSRPPKARYSPPPELPLPGLLIGLGLTPWPGPEIIRDGVCRVCGNRTLQPEMYCLGCDRWGLDHVLFPNHRGGWKPPQPRQPKKTEPEIPLTRKERRQKEFSEAGTERGLAKTHPNQSAVCRNSRSEVPWPLSGQTPEKKPARVK